MLPGCRKLPRAHPRGVRPLYLGSGHRHGREPAPPAPVCGSL